MLPGIVHGAHENIDNISETSTKMHYARL